MTNTKFRKRALLSSVAMLLVALVALGSATFAWFTSDPTADATGIKMTTSTSTGLLAKAVTDTNGFSHHTGLNGGKDAGGTFDLQPASLTLDGTTAVTKYYTATASDEDNYAAAASTITPADISATASAAQTAGVYAERIYLKTTGAESNSATVKALTVTMTTTSDTLASAVRCTVLDKDNKVLGTWGAAGHTYVTSAGNAWSTGEYTVTSGKINPNLAITGNGTANWVTVIVWLDGQDTNVKTTNVTNGAELLSSLKIDFSLNA